MTGALLAAGLIASALMGGVGHALWTRHRVMTCDGCRIENMGNGTGGRFVPHTCSRDRAVYKDKHGNLYQFGERRRAS